MVIRTIVAGQQVVRHAIDKENEQEVYVSNQPHESFHFSGNSLSI